MIAVLHPVATILPLKKKKAIVSRKAAAAFWPPAPGPPETQWAAGVTSEAGIWRWQRAPAYRVVYEVGEFGHLSASKFDRATKEAESWRAVFVGIKFVLWQIELSHF